jgi:uncharacterized membrane protein
MSLKRQNTYLENLPEALLSCLQQLPSAVWRTHLCHEPAKLVALFIPAIHKIRFSLLAWQDVQPQTRLQFLEPVHGAC